MNATFLLLASIGAIAAASLSNEAATGIHGGTRATIKEFNFIGSVYKKILGLDVIVGSGIIINEEWILTTGSIVHRVAAKHVRVRVGSPQGYVGDSLKVKEIVLDPEFNPTLLAHNIALLKLKKPLELSEYIQPVTFATSLPNIGDETVVAGFGLTGEIIPKFRLNKVNTTFLDHDTCQNDFYPHIVIGSTNLCTNKRQGEGPCVLDSGSPLLHEGKLIGSYIFSLTCGSTRNPDIYYDLTKSDIKEWIDDTTKPQQTTTTSTTVD